MSSLREVILTLQYCLETFEATCQLWKMRSLAQKARTTFGALFLPSKNWNVHNATRSEIAGRVTLNEWTVTESQSD